MTKKIILGAGLAGLIASCKFKDAQVFDGARGPGQKHTALLRFRSTAVADLTGIPFKKVNVTKGIYDNGRVVNECNITLSNQYSKKVTGKYVDGRSINNMDPVTRYIAPDSFYDELVGRLADENRITWGADVGSIGLMETVNNQIISTIPLPVMLAACGLAPASSKSTEGRMIHVRRFQLPHGTDLHQTIYFPDQSVTAYRASITGDVLICEFIGPAITLSDSQLARIAGAFGISDSSHAGIRPIDCTEQVNGKIITMPREQRESILYELTRDFNVFSVGRFATWRNILLDDVVGDLEFIDRLMKSSEYARRMISAKEAA